MPMVSTAKQTSTKRIVLWSPGLPNQSPIEPNTSSTPNAAIHGLRGPVASAIAPMNGEVSAIAMPAAAAANPHSACPSAGLFATAEAKYGA